MRLFYLFLCAQCALAQYCDVPCNPGQYSKITSISYSIPVPYDSKFMLKEYRTQQDLANRRPSLRYAESSLLDQTAAVKQISQCIDCEHDLDETTFEFVLACDDSELCFAVDTHCTGKCREHYVLKNSSCVLCNHTSCPIGSYMSYETCQCSPCVHSVHGVSNVNGTLQLTDTQHSVAFKGNGLILDDANSCQEECVNGYFMDTGTVQGAVQTVCIEHSALNCTYETEFLKAGTKTEDARCERCVHHCPDAFMIQNCTASSQSICVSCNDTLQRNEEFVHSNCTKQCVSSAIRDETGECQVCDMTCDVGFYRPSNASSCAQCLECGNKPSSNSHYVQQCVWTCDDRYAYDNSTHTCKSNEIEVNFARVVNTKQFVLSCAAGEYLVAMQWSLQSSGRTYCESCRNKPDVLTPDVAYEGVTWSWVVIPNQDCTWQCNNGRYKFTVDANVVTCYEWSQFAALSAMDDVSDVIVNENNQEIAFTPPVRPQIKMISEWKIAILCIVAVFTTKILLQR